MQFLYQADSKQRLAETFQSTGHFHKARAVCLSSHRLYKKSGDIPGQITSALRLGDIDRQLENFDTAILSYSKAAKLSGRPAGRSLPPRSLVDALCGRALCFRALGKYQEAEKALQHVLIQYQNLKDSEGIAYTLWALGTTQRFRGRLSQAEKNLRASVRLYNVLNDDSGMAYALCGLGGTLRMRGLARNSGTYYRIANRIFRREKDGFGTAYSLCGMANSLRLQGRVRDSLPIASKAMALYRLLKLKGPLAFVLWSVAQSQIYLKNFKAAESLLKEAEKLFKSVQDRRGLLYVDLGWGEYFRGLKNPRADHFYRRALMSATKQSLLLEIAHAKFRLSNNKRWFAAFPTLP